MAKAFDRASRTVWANLGHCPYCMKKAFRTAVVACSGLAAATALHLPFSILVLFAVATVGLVLLWIAHLLAFGLKTSVAERQETKQSARRALLINFGRAVAFAAVGTTMPPAFVRAAQRRRFFRPSDVPCGIGRCTQANYGCCHDNNTCQYNYWCCPMTSKCWSDGCNHGCQ